MGTKKVIHSVFAISKLSMIKKFPMVLLFGNVGVVKPFETLSAL